VRLLITFYLEPITNFLMLLVLGAYSWRVDKRFRYRMLTGYYLVATALLLQTLSPDNNIHIYNVLYMLTGLVFAIYFFAVLDGPWRNKVALALALPPVGYFLYNLSRGGNPLFDSLGYALSSICIVVMIFLYFHQLLNNVSEAPLSRSFDFWLISGLLTYHLGSFGIFLTYNSLTQTVMAGENYSNENRDLLTYLWGLHNVLLFLSAVVATIGLGWILYRKK
jgi:hypothetical protein